jgi:purine-binding chemotaxis protein CheW
VTADARRILDERARALARPAVAASQEHGLEVITFSLADERYGLESRFVHAVFRLGELARLPGSAAPVFGMTAWRGDLLTILDLRPLLGLRANALNDLGRAIVLGRTRAAFGILADEVHDLVRLPLHAVREPPEGLASREYVRGLSREALLIFDAELLLARHA